MHTSREPTRARLGLFAILICGTVLSGGCGAPPRIAPLGPDSVILAFGDSLTAGDDADRKNSYPALLQERLGCKVINAGVSGEVSSQGVKRLPLELDKCDPQLVILCHGGNDLLGKSSDDAIVENLEAMVRIASRRGANVILVGVPRPGLRLKTAGFYREIADRLRIPSDTKTVADILSHPSLKADQVHPNAAGNRRLAEALAALITKSQPK